jgi:hypothetical protein
LWAVSLVIRQSLGASAPSILSQSPDINPLWPRR